MTDPFAKVFGAHRGRVGSGYTIKGGYWFEHLSLDTSVIERERLMWIEGEQGVGKTALALSLAWQLTTGLGKVGYFSFGDTDKDKLLARSKSTGQHMKSLSDVKVVTGKNEDVWQKALDMALKLDVVVLDGIQSLIRQRSFLNQEETAATMDKLSDEGRRRGTLFIVTSEQCDVKTEKLPTASYFLERRGKQVYVFARIDGGDDKALGPQRAVMSLDDNGVLSLDAFNAS